MHSIKKINLNEKKNYKRSFGIKISFIEKFFAEANKFISVFSLFYVFIYYYINNKLFHLRKHLKLWFVIQLISIDQK